MKIEKIIIVALSVFMLMPLMQAQNLFLASMGSEDIVHKTPLWNPDRGFHLESIYQATDEVGYIPNPYGRGAGQGQVGSEKYPDGFMDTRNEDFQSEGDAITLTQLYIYLTSFWDKDINQAGLDNIQTLFNGLRTHNVKAILRFAYSRDNGAIGNGHSGDNPTFDRIMGHLEQLKPLIQANWDVVSVVEVGLLGTWGEWTPRFSTTNNNTIAKTMFNIIPEGYGMVVRYIDIRNDLKSVLSADQMNYIGFCNDYFTTGLKNCGSSDWCMYSSDYNHVAETSFTYHMRGEIPYNEGPPWGFDIFMDPLTVLKVLKDHHYSSMDITQNFKDNITYWKTVKVQPELLKRNNIFFDENYFKENGKFVVRSFYEFVRDHLGYRLNVVNTPTFQKDGSKLKYNIEITNTGFATVLNPKPVYLVLIDSNNQLVKELPLNDVKPRDWQPWAKGKPADLLVHSLSGSVEANVAAGTYKVGIWIPDSYESIKNNPAYCVKFATDNGKVSHWKNTTRMVNIIGNITF
ncbi:DUF4832 domain-containing protein [Paludibacter sp. 221]|uniref:DUF4832 domain-containing protein n=1 Tax=Paludibacter sp. 221 TaxID=2302939 RepID=UPI0013D3EDED|nr:DUF4874 domain-containing protein [Paludibacter sp. 221]NDV46731.1 DUF4832 domain-containing protein [Paludibacter sp. 221]